MQEVVAAAKSVGVILPSGIEDRMINIDPLTMYLRPSMLEDVQKVWSSCIASYKVSY